MHYQKHSKKHERWCIVSDKEFLKTIVDVAARVKGASITEQERQRIIELFNQEKGSAYERAVTAIEAVIGKLIPKHSIYIEKNASLNNLQNLLAQMSAEASKWQKDEKK